MGVKKTLVGLAIAASAALFGCTKDNSEVVYQDRYMNPVANLTFVKDDGSKAGFSVNNGTDMEAFIFDSVSNNFSNVSNDQNFSDYPVGFLGSDVVAVSYSPDSRVQKMKIFTSAGVICSDDFDNIDWPVVNDAHLFFEGEINYNPHVYTFNPVAGLFEKLIPSANNSSIDAISDDRSVALLRGEDYYSDDTVYLLKSGVLTPLINLNGHYGEEISKDNKKAYVRFNYNGNEGFKVVDVDTSNIQSFNVPSGTAWAHITRLSNDGLSAIVELENLVTSNYGYYRLDTVANTWTSICPSYSYPLEISSDGAIIAFDDESVDSVRLYNASTPEYYNPLPSNLVNSAFLGFSSGNKVVLRAQDNSTWNLQFVLHDPATKTNTLLGDSVNYESEWSSWALSPNKELLAIEVNEIATGYDVVLLEDLVVGSSARQVIKQAGFDLSCLGISSDNAYVFVGARGASSNLLAYNRQTQAFVNITNHPDRRVDSFDILEQSDDGKILYFQQRFDNGTKEIMEYEFATGELTKISN